MSFSQEEVDEEVYGGVRGDEEVRDVLQDEDGDGPVLVASAVVAADRLVTSRDLGDKLNLALAAGLDTYLVSNMSV